MLSPPGRVLIVGAAEQLPDVVHANLADADITRISDDAPLHELEAAAPFDQVIVVEPTRAVAWAWVQYTCLGGLVLCVLDPTGLTARPVLLRREAERAHGQFLASGEALKGPTIDLDTSPVAASRVNRDSRHRRTNLPLRVWELDVPWFLAAVTMPDGLTLSRLPDATGGVCGVALSTADGSWCEITTSRDPHRRAVVEGGPVDLFGHLARTYRQWEDLGRPSWNQLTLTVTPTEHVIRGGHAEWRLLE